LAGGPLNITGCANITQSTLHINLTKQELDSFNGQYYAMYYQFLQGKFENISIVTGDNCINIELQQAEYTGKSLLVLFNYSTKACKSDSLPTWAVVVICLGAGLIVIVVVAIIVYFQKKYQKWRTSVELRKSYPVT